MKGRMTIIGIKTIEHKDYDGKVPLADLQAAVGGYIETVPYWDFRYQGLASAEPCLVFCNEHGKLENLPFNIVATALWHSALAHHGIAPFDDLCGPVAIVSGDEAFMRSFTDDDDEEDEDF